MWSIGLLRATRQLARRAGGGEHELSREMLQTLQHALGAIKEIKALGREDFFYRAYAEQQRTRLSLGHLGVTLEALPPLIIETVFVCGALLVVVLLTAVGRRRRRRAAAARTVRLRRIPDRADGQPHHLAADRDPLARSAGPDAVRRLSARHPRRLGGSRRRDAGRACATRSPSRTSTYTYPGAATPALRGVSLTVRRGESLGIVGPTGAGKSTLVDLIVGLLPPSVGRVCRRRRRPRRPARVPGGATSATCRSRSCCSTTRCAATSRSASPIATSTRRASPPRSGVAQLDATVAGLPHGLDTGSASAACGSPAASASASASPAPSTTTPTSLVLDEATAALDTATEAAVADALRALRGEKTVLLIAHRLSTVRGCDRIAVIADGRLADCGTYDELLARSDMFRRLAG